MWIVDLNFHKMSIHLVRCLEGRNPILNVRNVTYRIAIFVTKKYCSTTSFLLNCSSHSDNLNIPRLCGTCTASNLLYLSLYSRFLSLSPSSFFLFFLRLWMQMNGQITDRVLAWKALRYCFLLPLSQDEYCWSFFI